MNIARVVVLVIALSAGGVAAYLARGTEDKSQPVAEPVAQLPTVEILVAKSDIGLGQPVKPEDLQWQTWPASASNNLVNRASRAEAINEIAGSIARAPFIAGEPIREQKLVKANGSGFMAAILPTGMRAISTEISPETGAGGFILPNDRVDVILTKREKNPDGKGADVAQSEIILSNIRVLAIDQAPKEKEGINTLVGRTVTLELKPEQAETLARARQSGTLALALRSITDVNATAEGQSEEQVQKTKRERQRGSLRGRQSNDGTEVTERTSEMKFGENQSAMRTVAARTLLLSAAAALTLAPLLPVVAAESDKDPVTTSAIGPVKMRFLSLGIGKSVVVDLPRDVKDVLVADPKIANAVVRSSQRAYIIGGAVGQTNVVFFDADGQQVASYDIAVKRDLNGVRAALKQTLPGIQIEGVGDSVVLTGSVSSPVEAQQAGEIAARLVGGAEKVVNSIVVRGRDQVMLKVTVAEVRRDIVKQLGVDLSASMNYGTAAVVFNNSNPFTANNAPLVSGNGLTGAALNKAGLPSVTATLRAMESAGVVRTLAEPNLTAISGESATFISGGEFPIPTGVTCQTTTAGAIGQCVQTVSFKKFGISLNFTPVVLTEGRISLRVMTEVSEVSTENALQGGAGGTTIPSIKTRRAETTLEIPSGGSVAMAGLIQEQTKQAINGMPGVDQIPIFGRLFRSQDFVNHQTELMVIVTPYVVRAVAQKELSRPDDGFAPASDSQSALLGRINRIYGVAARVDPDRRDAGQFRLHH